ncbi:TP901 family phage tail tape measure protein [Pseudomonas sp. JAI115]|uniref:phage tail tape measure protein n=1 Tax=Pseudomonas sp. JAI115 TaxID=2723061 RepID=UPI0016204AF3|nr:phage tail tape measure protein [Pseudomonas sp. JAI115]MBB6153715.1 TP901 family phage tail tape measure protein [Pseudomonas sp. JAI115]
MANDLKIRLQLDAINRVSGPLKKIYAGSNETAQALKGANEQLKALKTQQANVSSFKKQQDAIAGTSAQLVKAQAHLRQMKTALGSNGEASAKFKNDLRKAHEAVRDLTSKFQEQRRGLIPHITKLKEAGISTGNLGAAESRLKTSVEAANRALTTQKERLSAVAKQQSALAKHRAVYDKQQQFAGQLAGKGAASMAGGGAALYGGARVLAPGMAFDASMSRVQAITRLEGNSEELKGLRQQSRDLGGSTMFTAGQAADAQGFLGMAVFDPKAIKASMPGMLDLAAAGGAELAQTADIASNILSGLGMSADQMGRLGDVLVGTFTRSNTDLAMLGETMKYAAPMAKTYGVELEVAAAMAGKLGDAGLQGSMGGTALSTVMNRLAAPPKAAAAALDQLKINTVDANGNLRQMPDILKEIHDKTKGMGTATKGGLLKAIAGAEAVKGMAQLVDEAGSGELQKLIATLRQTEGEASKTAKVMADNLKGDLTTLGSAWEDLGIELQEQQDGPLRGLAQSVTGIIRDVKAWAAENPKLAAGLVKTVAIVAALAVALGGLLVTVASVLLPFIALRLMFAQLGVRLPSLIGLFWNLGKTVLPFVGKALLLIGRALMLNPIGLAITAIAAAAYLLYANWDAVKTYFGSAWEEIKAGFSGGVGSIVQTLMNFSPLGLLYQAFAGVMSYLGVDLPNRFTAFGGMIIDGLVNGITQKFGSLKETMSQLGDSATGWFKEKLGIHSPSRVFAELGGFTMEGLTQGLDDGAKGPLSSMGRMTQQLTAAGMLAVGTASMPALAVDERPPLSSIAAPSYDSHDHYEINIHTTPGMDAQAIARVVRAELANHASQKAARQRSSLTDRD